MSNLAEGTISTESFWQTACSLKVSLIFMASVKGLQDRSTTADAIIKFFIKLFNVDCGEFKYLDSFYFWNYGSMRNLP